MKKSDLKLPKVAAPIKIGSQVVFIDGSYTLSINSNSFELKHELMGLSDEIYTVIAINVSVPTSNNMVNSLHSSNNCIVKSEDGDIVFCSNINLHNIKEIFSPNNYTLKKSIK